MHPSALKKMQINVGATVELEVNFKKVIKLFEKFAALK